MNWLPELQRILGQRIRIEKGSDSFTRTSPLSHEETWLPLGNGQFLVVEDKELSSETVEVIRFMAEKGVLAENGIRSWLDRLISNEWGTESEFREFINGKQLEMQMPSFLAVLTGNLSDSEAVLALLREMLSDQAAYLLETGPEDAIWLWVSAENVQPENIKQLAARWLDTLSTELYLEGRLGVSLPIKQIEDVWQARIQAETALKAGKSFFAGQKIHLYGELGLAHLLNGASPQAKQLFLQEVMPAESAAMLTQEYRETIQAFVRHAQNIAETARGLYVHRNTLLYRLDKIDEITGKDIRKFQDLMALWIALMLRNENNEQ